MGEWQERVCGGGGSKCTADNDERHLTFKLVAAVTRLMLSAAIFHHDYAWKNGKKMGVGRQREKKKKRHIWTRHTS